MSIYSSSYKYRRIYEQHFGPIPIDENGRTYDIHHLDGNRLNNDPLNLIAVSIQEHYNIHLSQGDYGACTKIKRTMSLTPEEQSALVSEHNKKLVNEGRHNFLGGKMQKETQLKRVSEGTHHWLSGDLQRISTQRRLANGTHPFQEKWTCEHCGVSGKNKAMYNRWHNDNCKLAKITKN
jgi:hypothetical protein